jgi:nicotinamidase-related amidase
MPVVHLRHDSAAPGSTYRPGQPGSAFKSEVMPRPDETITAKKTNSAFIGTGLDAHLRDQKINELIITGVTTNNSVEAIVRMAGDLIFETHVVSDATVTFDKTDLSGRLWIADEVHSLSLANMAGEYANVLPTEEVLEHLPGSV